ncbi:MAG: hypothetical protein WC309_03055 [Candidatus Paceibacterota bacterium]|jgi:Tfp pilus assembly protein PilN
MVKVIPKEEVKEKDSLFIKLLFWFSVLLVLVSGGLAYLINWQVNTKQQSLLSIENQISKMGTDEQKKFKEQIFTYKKKIDDVVLILKNHKAPTVLFQTIESSIHPQVELTDFYYRGLGQEKISITGQVFDLTSLAQQIVMLESNPNISKVLLSSVLSGKSAQIIFKMDLSINLNSLIMQ